MDVYGKIAQAVKQIAGQKGVLTFPAKVKSVSNTTCTIEIAGMDVSDVRLRAVENSDTNLLLITPKQNSDVIVTDLSGGAYTDLLVIGYSQIESIQCKIDSISFKIDAGGIILNDGTIGAVKLDALVSWMQKVSSDLNTLTGLLLTTPVTGIGVPLGIVFNPTTPVPQQATFEDTKVKH